MTRVGGKSIDLRRLTMRPMGLVKKLKNYNFFRFLTRAGESNCCLRKFGEVGPFCELYGAKVDINTENS